MTTYKHSQAATKTKRNGTQSRNRHFLATAALSVTGALVASAVLNRYLSKKAERDNPPAGKFLEVNGVRLHYVECGSGEPLVLLHGNGSMVQDFQSSGLMKLASRNYRVIAFDRPGYGHSERPRSTIWTPAAQADLIKAALQQLGASTAIVLGHSWGASVALALALNHPQHVRALVLASGYYYPTIRPDFFAVAGPAVPVIGDLMRHTISPLLARAMWPLLMRTVFGPAETPAKFEGFSKELALRPSQIRASAAESGLLIPAAHSLSERYSSLAMPVVIIAGAEDRFIDIDSQSKELHAEVPQSTFHSVAGSGHMVHQTGTVAVMAAIDEAAGAAGQAKYAELPLAA